VAQPSHACFLLAHDGPPKTAITTDALIEQEIGQSQLDQYPAATATQREVLEGIGEEPWGEPTSRWARKARKDG
jgi:hypothetical protein